MFAPTVKFFQANKPIFKIVPLEKAPVGCALCWDVPKGQGDYPSGTACHLLCRGGFAKLSPLLEEMPDRAGGYIILGLTPETRSAESLVSLAVRLGLANAFFAFSCMCCVDILGVCFEDGFCFFTAFAALVSFLLSCAKFTRRVYSSFFLC